MAKRHRPMTLPPELRHDLKHSQHDLTSLLKTVVGGLAEV